MDGSNKKSSNDINKTAGLDSTTKYIFDTIPMAVSYWNSNYKLIDSNSVVLKLFNISSKGIYIDRFLDFSPKYQPCGKLSEQLINTFIKKGFLQGFVKFNWMHQKLDGTPIPTEMFCSKVNVSNQDILISYTKDLRQENDALNKLIEANRLTKLMFESSPIFIEYWDKDYKLINCNKSTVDFFNFKSKAAYIKGFSDVLTAIQSDGTNSINFLQENLQKAFKNKYHRFELWRQNTSGEVIIVDVEALSVNYLSDDIIITYSTDITKLVEAFNLIREADERSKIMLDGTPVACYLIDNNYTAIDCNKETLKLFKFNTKDEAIKNLNHYLENNGRGELLQHFETALKNGNHVFEWELTLYEITIPCNITMVRFSHRRNKIIAVYIFDMRTVHKMIKEMRKAEVAEENSQAKSRFLARMSHEIRTPITAVLGISEIQLQNTSLPLSIEEAFARIYSSSRTLLAIVNDILDLSKIESGKMSIILGKYQVASLINDIVQLNLFRVGSKVINFNVELDEGLPSYLIGDELRIKQIFNNLISNAFKYTDKGFVNLKLSFEPLGGSNILFIMHLNDTGQGMTIEQIKALRDEYTRFNEKKNHFVEGTGLGMQIVYSMAELMDAKVEVESKVNIGTKVTVKIPQQISGEDIIGKEVVEKISRFEYTSISSRENLKFVPEPMPYGSVLVVDDTDTNLYVAKGLLSVYSLSIETCTSGYAAIEKVKNGRIFDIIFMDHMMPKLDGIETTRELRKMGYTSPIVALTANAIIGQADEFLKVGFDNFVSKPIETTHLNSVLNKYIRDKQPASVLEATRLSHSKIDTKELNSIANLKGSTSEFAIKLRQSFAKEQRNFYSEIKACLDKDDFKTAHRLAHTVKGTAGLIGETKLQSISTVVEKMLRVNIKPTTELTHMVNELESVLSTIKPAERLSGSNNLNKEEIKQVLNELEPLLKIHSVKCIELCEKLKGIPEASILIRQIEDFDFAPASLTLPVLKDVLEL